MADSYGRWRNERSLGGGAQGATFLVSDQSGEHVGTYVLKLLIDKRRLDRFRREAATLARIDHPNVLKLVDFDLDGKKPYLVTEYCTGGDLDHNRQPWTSDVDAGLQLFLEVCEGVAAAHREDVVHRDIKPANIFLRTPTGPAVVGDFGIAYEPQSDRITEPGRVMGARGFTAPELEHHALGSVPPSCDVYSLGKLLYWLLSGGMVAPREGFRLPDYDLVANLRNPYMEHANRLLDVMIVANPDDRLPRAGAVLRPAANVARRMRMGNNAPSGATTRVPQPCQYCGSGLYRVVAVGAPYELRGVRFDSESTPDWRILVCTDCGHVQWFRVDKAKLAKWWRESD